MEGINSTDVQDESGPSDSVVDAISDSSQNANELALPSLVKPLILSKCIVYPCNHQFAFHEPRSLSCRVVHITGLPKMATKEIVEEIFEKCGRILDIQMSNMRCQIKFASEIDVRNALHLSGCTVRIENKDDHLYSGELSIDCIDTNAQLIKALEKNNIIMHSLENALSLIQKLEKDTFEGTLRALKIQMEQGVCNRANSETFCIVIQKIFCHLRSLLDKYWEENELFQEKLKQKHFLEGMLLKYHEVEKIFNPPCMRKICNFLNKQKKIDIKLMKVLLLGDKNMVHEELKNLETDEASDESENEVDNTKMKQEEKDKLLAEERKLVELKKKETHKRSFDEAKIEESHLAKRFKENSHSQNVKNGPKEKFSITPGDKLEKNTKVQF